MQIAVRAMESRALTYTTPQSIYSFCVIVSQKARLKLGVCQIFPDQRRRKRKLAFVFDPCILRINELPILLSICLPDRMQVMHTHMHLAQMLIGLGVGNNVFTIFKQV